MAGCKLRQGLLRTHRVVLEGQGSTLFTAACLLAAPPCLAFSDFVLIFWTLFGVRRSSPLGTTSSPALVHPRTPAEPRRRRYASHEPCRISTERAKSKSEPNQVDPGITLIVQTQNTHTRTQQHSPRRTNHHFGTAVYTQHRPTGTDALSLSRVCCLTEPGLAHPHSRQPTEPHRQPTQSKTATAIYGKHQRKPPLNISPSNLTNARKHAIDQLHSLSSFCNPE